MTEIDQQGTEPSPIDDQPSSDPTLPEGFTLKENLRKSPRQETWIVFDRQRKKKWAYKRFHRAAFSDGHVARFLADVEREQQLASQLPPNLIPLFLRPQLFGADNDWFWYARETAGTFKSLEENVLAEKLMRPLELSKRFLPFCQLLIELHRSGWIHRNIKPANIFLAASDSIQLADSDLGHFHDPSVWGSDYDPALFGENLFLAPEQRSLGAVVDSRSDLWAVAACMAYATTGQTPENFDPVQAPQEWRSILEKSLAVDPGDRFQSIEELRDHIARIGKASRPTLFSETNPNDAHPVDSILPVEQPISAPPENNVLQENQSTATATPASTASSAPKPASATSPATNHYTCLQCHAPVVPNVRACPKCNRPYEEPCLECNALNPFWLKNCRSCGVDLAAAKQKTLANLNMQQQYVMKLREACSHEKALPVLKMMSLVSHPDFSAFREWAKAMIPIVQKERRDIRTYVDGVRAQAKATFEAQKYDRVQQIIEQMPPQLVDEELRKLHVEAGECITEVDSIIREIRNAIASKQYNTLLSCVQRYLELKAHDPEARSLQEKIEKLTTVTTPTGIKLRRIPSGKFYMGSHESDEFIRNNERPQHRVSIPKNFFIGVYPITQADFLSVFDYNPSIATENPACPVDNVTWFGAIEFCNLLSEKEGFQPYYEMKGIKRRSNGMIERAEVTLLGGEGYRLPSEAEWEYACRAGSITPWCFGDLVVEVGLYAWYFDNSQMESQPVGQKKPNSWGLYDMHGNIMEWCYDFFDEFYYQHCTEEESPLGPETGTTRVIRGGSWQFGAEATRSPYRNSYNPEQSSSIIGFRILRAASEGGF